MLKRQDAASTGHAPVERPGGEVVFGIITRICYNAFNAPVTVTDANGIVTEYSYNDAGCVTRIVRRDGSEVLSPAGPVSSKGTSYPAGRSLGVVWFNDLLGTTVGAKSGNRYSAAALSAFGERLDKAGGAFPAIRSLGEGWFTGKPHVAGLGHVFLMRNYRAGLGKWQTADPLGYPDGWNQLAYCGNGVTGSVDLWGCRAYDPNGLTAEELYQLNGALRMWIIDISSVGQIFADVRAKSLTLSFLKRYMNKSGDQTLDYSVIAGEAAIINSNLWVVDQVKGGNITPSNYSISGPWWENDDLASSIGGCLIRYNVSPLDGYYIIDCSISNPYDFHSKSAVQFPYLEFEGMLYGWKGGETVYDTWMGQLAEYGYASVFTTTIKWQIRIKE